MENINIVHRTFVGALLLNHYSRKCILEHPEHVNSLNILPPHEVFLTKGSVSQRFQLVLLFVSRTCSPLSDLGPWRSSSRFGRIRREHNDDKKGPTRNARRMTSFQLLFACNDGTIHGRPYGSATTLVHILIARWRIRIPST